MLQLIQPHITAYLVGFSSLLTLSQGKLHLGIKTLSFFLMHCRVFDRPCVGRASAVGSSAPYACLLR